MKSETIQELMMFLCTSRFDLEEQEAKELEQFFSLDEIEALREEKDEKPDDIEIEAISDTEEQDERSDDLIAMDDDAEPQLPENTTQLRMSGRKRKSREDNEFEHY
jgi:hypothetical protein